jgi:hypothetical protein
MQLILAYKNKNFIFHTVRQFNTRCHTQFCYICPSSKEPHTYNLTHVLKVALHFHATNFNPGVSY